ncbi:MAG TPA: hypothetical protein VGJ13_12850 [Pseudonocardiaceae bacterium]
MLAVTGDQVVAGSADVASTRGEWGRSAFAHTNAAIAGIATGDLDRAVSGIGAVLALPASHRLGALSQRLDRAQRLLTAPGWQGSRPARELRAQIADFRVDTATRALST